MTKQIDIIEIETENINISTPIQTFIQIISTIELLDLVLTCFSLLDLFLSQSLHNIFLANINCKSVVDHIYAVLLLNTLERLVVEGVLDYVIRKKEKLCITRKDQLLLYIWKQRDIGKSCVIYILKMSFTLLDKKNELILLALTGYIIKAIRRNMMYTVLSISTCKAKSLCIYVSRIVT